jgi:hypothetical protein
MNLRLFAAFGGLILLTLFWPAAMPRSFAQTSCDSGVDDRITSDATWSGDVYIDSRVVVRNQATLTIEPGTNVFFCGEYDIFIDDISDVGGTLIAEGTAENPITFTTDPSATRWGRLLFNGTAAPLQPSRVRHAVFENGGGSTPPDAFATIMLSGTRGSVDGGPLLEHVTIRNSGSYGLYVRTDDTVANPFALSNLTVSGSARAPLLVYAGAMRGLGSNLNLSGNAEDVIEIGAGIVGGGRTRYDQTWRNYGVPYKLRDKNVVTLVDDRNPILRIEPGVTIQMGEEAGFRLTRGGLIAEGTAAEPITFERAPDAPAPWGNIEIDDRFSPSASSLAYVNILDAGDPQGAVAIRSGTLSIKHAQIRRSAGPGVYLADSFLQISDSLLESNDVGVLFTVRSTGVLRNNSIVGNPVGVDNNDGRGTCVDAIGNYWGSAAGPADNSAALDDCNRAASNSGSSDSVSDNVLYSPWLSAAPGSSSTDLSSIKPDDFWLIADGEQSTTLRITLRDGQGRPLAGKQVALETTRGDLVQPTAPTDQNGMTTAHISAMDTGEAIITARNLSDNRPIEALAAVFFWRGPGDTGGLIDPRGAPYATPNLILEGLPFQQNLPMFFKVPMQNTNPTPVEVTVTYDVSSLGIGNRWTPVATVERTLQPGENWDAAASWLVSLTGHFCVRYTINYTILGGSLAQSGETSGSKNVDSNEPSDNDDINPYDTINTGGKFGLGGVREQQKNAGKTAGKVNNRLNDQLVFQNLQGINRPTAAPAAQREHQQLAPVPPLTSVTLEPGDGVSTELAAAANAAASAAGDVGALRIAISETRIRIQGASLAGDPTAVRAQYDHYAALQIQLTPALNAYADSIDALLTQMRSENLADEVYSSQDYADELARLQSSGFNADELADFRQIGLGEERIAIMLNNTINTLDAYGNTTRSFYEVMELTRDDLRDQAAQIFADYGDASSALANLGENYVLEANVFEFNVGNPQDTTRTVDLRVRPVNLPLGWTYELSRSSIELDPGASTRVSLRLVPGGSSYPTDFQASVAVEGFIDDENIGGIVLNSFTPAPARVYLPFVQSPIRAR